MAQQKQLSTAQYRQALQEARQRHDLRYEIDQPKPEAQEEGEHTSIEKAVGHLWIAWLILALAGALISLPHTLKAVLATVDLPLVLAIGYSAALFVGVELALVTVALVSALKGHELEAEPKKQASLAGLVNSLASRIGLNKQIDLDHLPDRKPATGAILVGLLFIASLTFNQVDSLKDVPMLSRYGEEILLISRLMAGALGPGLLLIAGHRFAHEVVKSATTRKRAEQAYQLRLQEWQEGRDQSWKETGEEWIADALSTRQGRISRASLQASAQPEQPEQEYEPVPLVSTVPLLRANGNGQNGHNGNGRTG